MVTIDTTLFITKTGKNQPIRLPGLKSGVCSGLILSGAFCPDLTIGVWRRRTYQQRKCLGRGALKKYSLRRKGFTEGVDG